MNNLNSASLSRYALRLIWIALRLAAVFVMIRQGSTFVYQGF
jgi:hypothetical protein